MNTHVLLPAALIAAMAFPATAQNIAANGTLRIQGAVMVSSGGEFTTARDGQPIMAGQRIMVGENASATVNYARDCKRSYESAGVYTIEPARCDTRRKDDQSQEGHPTATTVAIVVGSAVAAAAVIQGSEETPPDHPISR
jgi:hypothetical protein